MDDGGWLSSWVCATGGRGRGKYRRAMNIIATALLRLHNATVLCPIVVNDMEDEVYVDSIFP